MTSRLLPLLAIVVAVGLVSTGCDKPMGMTQPTDMAWYWVVHPQVYVLKAGQNADAGTVTVWHTTDMLYIKYEMTGDWWLKEAHVHVDVSLRGIPQANGNPRPGRFEFSNTFNPRVRTYTYEIPWRDGWVWDEENGLYIATHAVAQRLDSRGRVIQEETGWAGPYDFPGRNWAKYIVYKRPPNTAPPYKNVSLPTDSVTARFRSQSGGDYARFAVDVSNVPTGDYEVSNGTWQGWCMQMRVRLSTNQDYRVQLWSSYDPNLPVELQSDYWHYVNYLINHRVEGATAIDVQLAIWHIVGDLPYPSESYPRARQMVDDALTNGGDWYPRSGDWIAVIAANSVGAQLTIIEVDP